MYAFHWSNATYMNPSRATIPPIRPHQYDSDGGRIREVLLYITILITILPSSVRVMTEPTDRQRYRMTEQ